MTYLQKIISLLRLKGKDDSGAVLRAENLSPAEDCQEPNAEETQGAEQMHQPALGVCAEGAPFIFYAAFATLIIALLGWKLPALFLLVLTFMILHFFRDPERVVPGEEQVAVSPADGKVVALESRAEPLTQEIRQKISIFMNVLDVHVNRSPVQGQVQKIHYVPGKFINAALDKSSLDNERNILQIKDEQGLQWTVVQIAGLVARRIVCRAQEQDELQKGQRLGLIKFGSRVDLYLPEGYEIQVARGDKVFAGQTVLARTAQSTATNNG